MSRENMFLFAKEREENIVWPKKTKNIQATRKYKKKPSTTSVIYEFPYLTLVAQFVHAIPASDTSTERDF